MVINRYLAALLSIAVLVLGALQVALQNGLELVEVVQLVPIVAGAVVTFVVPLLEGRWAGGLKTGAAIVATAASAIVPFVLQGYITPEQLVIVAIAVLNALAVEVGVQVRQYSTALSLAPIGENGLPDITAVK